MQIKKLFLAISLLIGLPVCAQVSQVDYYSQVQAKPHLIGTGGGTANAQVATTFPSTSNVLSAYSTGLEICWLPSVANTGTTPTLKINSLATKTIVKVGGAALLASDLTTTAVACAIYDGTYFELQNPQTSVSPTSIISPTPSANQLTYFPTTSTITGTDFSYSTTAAACNSADCPAIVSTVDSGLLFTSADGTSAVNIWAFSDNASKTSPASIFAEQSTVLTPFGSGLVSWMNVGGDTTGGGCFTIGGQTTSVGTPTCAMGVWARAGDLSTDANNGQDAVGVASVLQLAKSSGSMHSLAAFEAATPCGALCGSGSVDETATNEWGVEIQDLLGLGTNTAGLHIESQSNAGAGNYAIKLETGAGPSLLQNLTLGTGLFYMPEISSPSNPSSGQEVWYANSSTHLLSCKTSAGGNCNPGLAVNLPLSVGGTVNSGAIPCFNSTTNMESSATIASGVLIKGGGTGACVGASSITDNGTTISTTEPLTVNGVGTSGTVSSGTAGQPAVYTALTTVGSSANITAGVKQPSYTVSTLPSASSNSGLTVVVTDASTQGNCTVGSGTFLAYCRSNGTVWQPLGDGGGASGSTGAPVAFIPNNISNSMWNMAFETSYGVGYSSLSAIDWYSMTHLGFQGASPNSSGVLTEPSGFAAQAAAIVAAAHTNGVKVLLDLNDDSSPGSLALAITNHLSTLVTNVQSVVTSYGFDGVFIDFESSYTITLLNNFGSSMRTSCGASPACLLVAYIQVNNNDFTSGNNSSWDKIAVGTYNMSGTGDAYAWFNSALYGPKPPGYQGVSDALIMPREIGNGIPATKLLMGLPYFGVVVTGGGTAPRGTIGTTYTEQSYPYFYSTCSGNSATWDSQGHVPWVACGGGWAQWDNPQSLTDKVNYVIQNGLGGVFSWNLQEDYTSGGTTPALIHPLQNAVKLTFLGYGQTPTVISNGILASSGLDNNYLGNPAGQVVRLKADFTTANNTNFQYISPDATGAPITAGTGLVLTTTGYGTYTNSFSCELAYSQATANVAVTFGIQAVEIAPTNIFATGLMFGPTTAISGVLPTLASTTATAIVSGTPQATGTVYYVHLGGTLENPANSAGTLIQNQFAIMVSTASGSDAVTVKRGSYCMVGQ